ncbi:hypothetical protein P7H15_25635 [Paenibacillus larvae]|nr:hypothetical protein [Paenibacillus larvae]MDT2295509.1 hypothetical protein [Paenibacillus larvae]
MEGTQPKISFSGVGLAGQNGMIHIERGKRNRQYTLITILNYEIYQENEEKDIAKPLNDLAPQKKSKKRYTQKTAPTSKWRSIFTTGFLLLQKPKGYGI